jgi:uncharacterized protein
MSYKFFLPIGFLIFIFSILFAIKSPTQSETLACPDFNQATLNINQHSFKVALATTPEQQRRGLSGCGDMPQKNGMYFSLPQKKITSFWMKEMFIPIDMVWISDNIIIGIEHNVPAPDNPSSSNLPTYSPLQPIDAVLELSAGTSHKLNISVGDTITINRLN